MQNANTFGSARLTSSLQHTMRIHETAIDPGVPCKDVVPCRCESDLATRCFNLSWKHITCTSKTLDIACAWSALDPLLIRSSCSEFSSYLLFCSPLELTWGLDWQCLLASSPCVSAPCWRSTKYVPQLKKRRCSGKSGLGQEWQQPGHTLRQKFWQILTGRTQRRVFPLHYYYSFIFFIILLIKTYQKTSRLHHQNHSQIGRPHAITCLQDPKVAYKYLGLNSVHGGTLSFGASTFCGPPPLWDRQRAWTHYKILHDFTSIYHIYHVASFANAAWWI